MNRVQVARHVYGPLQKVLVFGIDYVHARGVLVTVRVGILDDLVREYLDVQARGNLGYHVLEVLIIDVPVLVYVELDQVDAGAIAPCIVTVTPLEGFSVVRVQHYDILGIVFHDIAQVIFVLRYAVGDIIVKDVLELGEIVGVYVVVAVDVVFRQVRGIRAALIRREVRAERVIIGRRHGGVSVDVAHIHLIRVDVTVDDVKERQVVAVHGRPVTVAVDVHVAVYHQLPVGKAYPAVSVGVGGGALLLRDAEERRLQEAVYGRVHDRQEKILVVRVYDVVTVHVHQVVHVALHGVDVRLVYQTVAYYRAPYILAVYIKDSEVSYAEGLPDTLVIAYGVDQAYVCLVEYLVAVQVTPQVVVYSVLEGENVLRIHHVVVSPVRHQRVVAPGYIRHVYFAIGEIIFALVYYQSYLIQVIRLAVASGNYKP